MSKTRDQLRADLARAMKRYHKGSATGGDTTSIIDTDSLAHREIDDQLIGSAAYILEDAGGAGAAPEGESRKVIDYDASGQDLTLEYALSAGVAAGDVYELFLAPLELEDWDLALELAISDAWPELYDASEQTITVALDQVVYDLISTAEDVLGVEAQTGSAWGQFPLSRSLWRVEGEPGELSLRLRQYPAEESRQLHVSVKTRFTLPSGTDTTGLDESYLLAAARTHLYQMLVDRAGSASESRKYLQLLGHWTERAAARKALLVASRVGREATAQRRRKGRK